MTDEAMSPLRRRMIEGMTIRKFAPKTQHDYVQRVKELRCVSRAITGYGELRGRAPLSTASGGERCWRADPQPDRIDVAVLLPSHAQALRHHRAHHVRRRAPQAAGVFVEALSYGATGKIQKMELRRRFAGHYSLMARSTA
jgi:hypothetical protein